MLISLSFSAWWYIKHNSLGYEPASAPSLVPAACPLLLSPLHEMMYEKVYRLIKTALANGTPVEINQTSHLLKYTCWVYHIKAIEKDTPRDLDPLIGGLMFERLNMKGYCQDLLNKMPAFKL